MRWITRSFGLAVGVALVVAGPSTRVLGIVAIIVNVAAAIAFERARRRGSLGPREASRIYPGTAGDTFVALKTAVERLGYKVLSVDEAQRGLVFNTGLSRKTWAGQDFTATVQAHSGSVPECAQVRLVGATSRRGLGAVQSVSRGETELLARRLLDQIQTASTRNEGK